MFIKIHIAIAVLFALLFMGCSSSIKTNTSLSSLVNGENEVIESSLQVEIPSCHRFNQPKKTSKSLLYLQKSIAYIFPNSTYKTCKEVNFKAYAYFTLPIYLNKNGETNNKIVEIASNKEELLSINIPSTIRKRINEVKADKYSTFHIDLSLYIQINNDLGETFQFKALSTYVNDTAFIFSNLSVKPNNSFQLKLSDASIDHALEHGYSRVLLY